MSDLGSGGLARIAVDDCAQRLFLEAAFTRSHRLRELTRAGIDWLSNACAAPGYSTRSMLAPAFFSRAT